MVIVVTNGNNFRFGLAYCLTVFAIWQHLMWLEDKCIAKCKLAYHLEMYKTKSAPKLCWKLRKELISKHAEATKICSLSHSLCTNVSFRYG